MNKKFLASAIGFALVASAASGPVLALDKGDWIVRFGVTNVNPTNDASATQLVPNGSVTVDSGTSLSINLGYMMTDNVALDILGAWPFKHDIKGAGTALAGAGKIGETKHLPPTVGLQYHFSPKASIRPYVGAGVNYTYFFSEDTTGVLAGTDLKLDSSWGLAAQAGVDFDINKTWFANLDVRYMDIDTTAHNPVAGDFDVKIDPWIITVGIGTRF